MIDFTNFINQFPYSDFHEMNLDWILKAIKQIVAEMNDFEAANSVSYEGVWDITKQYTAWSVVLAPDSYLKIAIRAVPSGIDIDNESYWRLVSPFKIDKNFDTDSYNAIANKPVSERFNSVEADISELDSSLHSTNNVLNEEIYTRSSEVAVINGSIEDLSDNLDAEIAARETADTTLGARIDAIIALPDGSTTADAELIDIRTGYNGIQYASAGDAVRDQAEKLYDDVIPVRIINEFEHGTFNNSTGAKETGATAIYYYRTIDPISIDDYISVYVNADYYMKYFLYGSDGSFLATTGNYRNRSITRADLLEISASAKYVHIQLRKYEDWSDHPFSDADLIAADYDGTYYVHEVIRNREDIEKINNQISFGVPNYYKANDYLKTKEYTITENAINAGKSGDTFVFITDLHWPANTKHSPMLVNDIIKNCPVSRVVLNGDYENSTSIVGLACQIIRDCIGSFMYPDVKTHVNIGNHEFNDPGANKPEQRLSNDQAWALVVSPQFEIHPANYYVASENIGFYIDNNEIKRRYFFIPCNYGSNIDWRINAWFGKALEEIPDGFDVVVFSHMATAKDGGTTVISSAFTYIAAMIDAYNTRSTYTYSGLELDYTDATGEVIAVFSGHTHEDEDTTTPEGTPIICTTTDNYAQEESGVTRTAGTIDEQAFDVVTIDKEHNKIKLTRIGFGSDREFNI